MSLLEKAQELKSKRNNKKQVSQEDIELALAWVRGEVTLAQCSFAWEMKSFGPQIYAKIAIALRTYLLSQNEK